ncbi:glycosyltransferase family 25 protein [Pseudodonghicola flavimaris]|uniref:Glycosyltransferase family 25 protein n=1 Tax=Pseudodonghicola flavimaris TaxID=3050036 RepID=A0ABT7F6X6_9RHOB|nr:glycosyltransferase family 25 protein [Pseudodonghicola flavimaris]MDK3020353.1 glycosyltransferase family 25 protein [Pseudodonghicola flavimaris]
MSLPAHFINLDRVPQRADFMQAQCAIAGFDRVHRFPAVDAASAPISRRYRPGRWGAYWSLLPSEVAVFESHRALWQRVRDDGAPAVLMEDDVLLSAEAGAVCSTLAPHADRYHMIKLDAPGDPLRLGPEVPMAGMSLRPLTGVIPSAAAYILTPEGAEILLRRSERYCDHLDDFLTRPHPGYRAFQLSPIVAMQGMFSDLSGRPEIPASIAGSERTAPAPKARADKGPVPYRLAKEIRRSLRRLSRRLHGDRALLARGGFIGTVPRSPDLPPYCK